MPPFLKLAPKNKCASLGCHEFRVGTNLFCNPCQALQVRKMERVAKEGTISMGWGASFRYPDKALQVPTPVPAEQTMSAKYPKYHKDVSKLTSVDVYQVHQLFEVTDPSGALQHASKKLLLSGVRTGGKTKFQDIKEARDTLNRWLEINSPELV